MTTQVYDEIVDFIAQINPREVSDFHVSEAAKARVAELIAREKNDGLTAEETAELNHYMQMEHVMRLAKARARKILAGG